MGGYGKLRTNQSGRCNLDMHGDSRKKYFQIKFIFCIIILFAKENICLTLFLED